MALPTVTASAAWPLIDRIRAALLLGLGRLHDADFDALLARKKLIVSPPKLHERL